MELQRKYYKITSLVIIALFMVSISYYQQVVLHHVSNLACQLLPEYAATQAVPSPPEMIIISTKVTAENCDSGALIMEDSAVIKNI